MMYVGDDTQNEDVFKYLNQNVKNKGNKTRQIKQETTIYSCTIGRKVTQANFFLTDTDHVLTMLEKMAQPVIVMKRIESGRRVRSQVNIHQ